MTIHGPLGVIFAVLGALSALTIAVPFLRHVAWEMLCAPYRLGQILEELKLGRHANERAAEASERALDEWKGATEAVRRLAGGHGARLDTLDKRVNTHDTDIRKLQDQFHELGHS